MEGDKNVLAWSTMHSFLTTNMTLPEAESALENLFGQSYDDSKWRPILSEINDLEPDSDGAQILQKIEMHLQKNSTPAVPVQPQSHDCSNVETDLLAQMEELKCRNQIHGCMLMLEEMLNPVEERRESEFHFAEDVVKEIAEKVQHKERVKRGDVVVVVVDEEEEEEEALAPQTSLKDLVETLKTLELQFQTDHIDNPDLADEAMALKGQLLKFQAGVQCLHNTKARQTGLNEHFESK